MTNYKSKQDRWLGMKKSVDAERTSPTNPTLEDRKEKSSFDICPWNIHRHSVGGDKIFTEA